MGNTGLEGPVPSATPDDGAGLRPAGAGVAQGRQAPDVRLERVVKRFDDAVAVDGISLEIPRGSFFALLGPSGCGKTTTLRMIGGFEEPTEGRIFLGDQDVVGLPPYRRDVNTVFQSYALFPHMSVHDNVAFGLERRKTAKGEIKNRVREILVLVGLAELGGRKPRQLSGGQQQRVALARALVNHPRVLLLDEPLGALDLKLRKQMQLELKRIQNEVGITFVHVTHDQEEAMTMADTIAVMDRGHIEQLGPPEELYERPATAFVAGFLGISNMLRGSVEGPDAIRLEDGTVVKASVNGKSGPVAAGVRPEKITIGDGGGANRLVGRIAEKAYIGVATQVVVETPAGIVQVFAQNIDAGGRVPAQGSNVTLSWSPESTFVVDRGATDHEEEEASE
jgi:spermidine/putrescine transport system ATP-binding protein